MIIPDLLDPNTLFLSRRFDPSPILLVTARTPVLCLGMLRNNPFSGIMGTVRSPLCRFFTLLLPAMLCLLAAVANADDLIPLTPKLPAPAFVGTPKDIPEGANVELPTGKPRPPLMVPKDVHNLAPSGKITTSDAKATPAALAKITDGDKEAVDTSIVLLRKGVQWVQFDLGSPQEIFAILIWHAHDSPKVYHGVVARVSDDADFSKDVHTLFNNDTKNVTGCGAGTDREYFETNEGKLIDAKGIAARYVRLYSHGSTDSALNEYTEVEIYGRPPK
jgi:hypothetical protein